MTTRAIFDHVLKTGGTSIRAAMCGAHGQEFVMPPVGTSHHRTMAHPRVQEFLSWHLWYLPGESLDPRVHYATMLREPIDRFLSQYYFHRGHLQQVQEGALTSTEVVQATRLSLDEYVRSGSQVLRRSFTNLQAIHFAWRVCADPESLSAKQLLDAAIASIDEYDLVGVFSDMQGFLYAYCDALSLPRQALPRLNVTPVRKKALELPANVMQILRDSNVADSALYAWAEQRFAKQRARPSFVPAAAAARRKNAVAPTLAHGIDFGSKSIRIKTVLVRDADAEKAIVTGGERMAVELICAADVTEPELTLGVALYNVNDEFVLGTNTRQMGIPLAMEKNQCYDLSVHFDAPVEPGQYKLTLALHRGESHLDGCYHWVPDALLFSVHGLANAVAEASSMPSIAMRVREHDCETATQAAPAILVKRRYSFAARSVMRKLALQMKSLFALKT